MSLKMVAVCCYDLEKYYFPGYVKYSICRRNVSTKVREYEDNAR